MSRPLVILGTGGGALDVLDVVDAINATRPTWGPIGFLDDDRPAGGDYLGLPVLGRPSDADRYPDCAVINAIGSDRSFLRRPEILASTGLPRDRFVTLVHPAASVSPRSRLGLGACVGPGASIGGGAGIGDHATICPGAIVGHDATVEDLVIIAPGAIISGFVRLGRNCYVGAGAAIRQRLSVGQSALIGMGAVVIRDVAAYAIVAGNPARPLRRFGRAEGPWSDPFRRMPGEAVNP